METREKKNASARSRTGGSTMATSNFTAKPLTPFWKFQKSEVSFWFLLYFVGFSCFFIVFRCFSIVFRCKSHFKSLLLVLLYYWSFITIFDFFFFIFLVLTLFWLDLEICIRTIFSKSFLVGHKKPHFLFYNQQFTF